MASRSTLGVRPSPSRCWARLLFSSRKNQNRREVITLVRKFPLIAITAIFMMFCVASVASANAAMLSQVGPELTPANVKSETQTMLQHDTGIQDFLHLNSSSAANIKVVKATLIYCTVGVSKLCPINTGKSGWQLVETRFRFDETVRAYRVEFMYRGKIYYVTFEQLCSNLLSGKALGKQVKRIVVTAKKPIRVRLVVRAYARAKTVCNGVTSIAQGKASLKRVTITVSSSAKGWLKIGPVLSAYASATATSKCKAPPKPNPCAANSSGSTNSGTACQGNTSTQGSTQNGEITCNTGATCTVVNNTTQTTVQVNANCSAVTTVVNGVSTTSYYDANGNQITEQICSSYTTTTPQPTCASQGQFGTYPNCFIFSVTTVTENQEFAPNNTNLTVCAKIGGAYNKVTSVQFNSDQYGAFMDGGLVTSPFPGTTNMWCDSTFATGSDMPPGNVSNITAIAFDATGDSSSLTQAETWQPAPTFQ